MGQRALPCPWLGSESTDSRFGELGERSFSAEGAEDTELAKERKKFKSLRVQKFKRQNL